MVLMNALERESAIASESFKSLLLILAPFAPHLAEHLYETVLDGEGSVHQIQWPSFDPELLEEDTVTIGVQIAGKTRDEITISVDASEEEALQAALGLPKIVQALPGGAPSRVIYRPGKILNLIPEKASCQDL
jgi:leucyl-tRNA synthetase